MSNLSGGEGSERARRGLGEGSERARRGLGEGGWVFGTFCTFEALAVWNTLPYFPCSSCILEVEAVDGFSEETWLK